MKRSRIAVAAAGATAVLGLTAAVPIIASAQDGSATPSPSASPSAGSGSTPDQTREERRAERQAELAKLLAAELGISEDRVADALTKVQEQLRAERQAEHLTSLEERLDAAVADGKLTQAQADAILEAAESGALPFGGGRGHGGHGGGFGGPGAPAPDATATPDAQGSAFQESGYSRV